MKLLTSILLQFFFYILISSNVFAGYIIFEDNFNLGNYDKWLEARNTGSGVWSASGEVMKAIHYGSGVSEYVPKNSYWDLSWNNYSFEVDINFISGIDKNIAFRYTDQNNWYGIHFSGGRVSLQKVIGGVEVLPVPVEIPRNFDNGKGYHIKIDVIDNHIAFYVDSELIIEYTDANSPLLTGKPALQASSGGTIISEVWFDNVVVTGLDGATPIPTPTTTPVPSVVPTPSTTPQPIRKVVFVPGLGASWNADALLNCKTENYSGDWTLAPYAEGFYNTVISALGEYGKPFYYDWRKDVRSQKDKLQNFINNLGEEKVNLVGHSLGGLVGRAYLEQTGDLSKLDKLMTAGSPHRGSPIAYPAWAAGDLWHDDLLTKIGITLLMKRCTGLSDNDREAVRKVAPSLNNLLPNFDYLRDKKTGILKPVEGMLPEFQNDWLSKSIFPPPSTNVSIRTLSGTGFRTIENLPVNDPSKQDIKNGNWLDGKPAGKEWTNEGDGTALLKSTQIDGLGSENRVINQTHGGLMTSEEGINEIFNFFGLNRNNLTFNKAPSSALIVIGYPANFWVKDKNGKVIKDKEGMIALMNPETQKYQFGLLPKKDKTLFIVAQFLEDGRTYWKEYEFKNVLPKFGNINYNQSDPNEDLLR